MAEQDYVHMPTLEEYAKRFERFFKFKRSDDVILEVRMHTFDGPVHWSYQMHHAFSELWTAVGHDTRNEVLIFTATALEERTVTGVKAEDGAHRLMLDAHQLPALDTQAVQIPAAKSRHALAVLDEDVLDRLVLDRLVLG